MKISRTIILLLWANSETVKNQQYQRTTGRNRTGPNKGRTNRQSNGSYRTARHGLDKAEKTGEAAMELTGQLNGAATELDWTGEAATELAEQPSRTRRDKAEAEPTIEAATELTGQLNGAAATETIRRSSNRTRRAGRQSRRNSTRRRLDEGTRQQRNSITRPKR